MTVRYRNIARVVKTHGKHGEVVAEVLRGLPLLVRPGLEVALTPPALKRDRFCRVERVTDAGTGVLVSFFGIDSISSAEEVVGCYLLARETDLDIDALTASLDELRGRVVVDARFGVLGTIVDVMALPANDVWVVDGGGYGEVLLPVIPDVLDEIPPAGDIPVHVMDGLVDLSGREEDLS